MFFEFSLAKAIPLMTMMIVLGFGLFFGFTFVNKVAGNERLVSQFIKRQGSELTYLTLYKLPRMGGRALAAVGLSTAHTQAAPTATTSAIGVPVLLYHGESESASAMSPAVFIDQMRTLHENGWRTVTLEQFEAFMSGKAKLPDRSFLLTYDDGRADAFYAGDPVLRDLGFTAVMFVVTGFSMPNNGDMPTNKFYLSKSELAYMARSGRWQLESHGDQDHRLYTVPGSASASSSSLFVSGEHFLSNKFWVQEENRMETTAEYEKRVGNDLAVSKQILELEFGRPVTAFAYPLNDYGRESVNFPGALQELPKLVRSHYKYAFYQTGPGNGDFFNYPNPNGYLVKRFEPKNDWSGEMLLDVLEGGRAKALPYATQHFGVDWVSKWGAIENGASLALTAPPDTTGASAFLDGSEAWKNYRLTATALVRQGTFSLIARHTASTVPYLVCAFSGDKIYLERHISGQDEPIMLSSARFSPPRLPATYTVSMSVVGPIVSCSAYGVAVEASLPSISPNGGIGFSIWHPEPGTAYAQVTQLRVDPL